MCGIAGILNLAPAPASAGPSPIAAAPTVAADSLRLMADAIRHRGPDDDGFYVDPRGRCGLAFRRLSIIDLSTGHQPLSNEDGTLWLVFNGEIYNYRDLRAELLAAGHAFRTQSDSETIVHGFEQWGKAVFARLHGMFAIALWDERRGMLTLARDRFGKKPLFVHREAGRLCFASETKAIRALPGFDRTLNPQAIHDYLTLQYVPNGDIFRGESKIRPGCYASIEAESGATSASAATVPQQRYYELPISRRFAGSYADATGELDRLLTHAVEKRLISDVPLGAFLSGGIDSSIVVGLMRKLGVSPLRTFSIGFADPRYDESVHARHVAKHFQTEHHEQIVTPRARDAFDELAESYDMPFADSSAIPTLLLSRFARESVTVALTGDAGDECFGGYDRYRAAELGGAVDRFPRVLRGGLARLAPLFAASRPKTRRRRLYRFLESVGKPAARRYLDWITIFPPAMLAEGYQPEFAARVMLESPLAELAREFDSTPGSPAQRAAIVDVHSYLPEDLLTKVDIASMATSLECRAPFLDHRLVEFALSLPTQWKITTSGGKRILKDWARTLLPPQIRQRRKSGFGVPIGEWFRGELRNDLLEALERPDGVLSRIFRADWLRRLFEIHVSGNADHEHRLWALFMLDRWAARWKPRW